MAEKEKTQYNSFAFNIMIYTITLILASAFPFAARTALSWIIETPAINISRGDASYLFDVVYPIVGFFTMAAYIFGGYYCAYYTSKKIAYSSHESFDAKRAKIQIFITSILSQIITLYFGFLDYFCGLFAPQYWYFPALIASWSGIIDKTDVTVLLANKDLVINNFVLIGLTPYILWMIAINIVLLGAGFTVAAYFGRKHGNARGLLKHEKEMSVLRAGK